ncbi:Lrp/AsnC family transcriptional regulator [bacterium]|nr:Lrp/AsnC family transcriptional regulator [bacterium]
MDAIDTQIAHILGVDGRLSNREIGRRLGIAEGTVRQRLSRLFDSGVLRVAAQANIESFPESYLAIVGVKIDGRRLSESAETIEQLPSVLTTMIVTGRYDIVTMVLAPSRQTLVDFVTDQLSKVQGVRDSETFVVLKNFGQWIPADKLCSMIRDFNNSQR